MSDINEALGVSENKERPAIQNLKIQRRYPALRTLSTILAIVAWLIAFFTLIIVAALFSKSLSHDNYNNDNGVSTIYPFIAFVVGAILFIVLLAYSEIIKVFVDIEENTRMAVLKSSPGQSN
jgi:tellurite resistance protein TehA-like permease